MQQDYFATDDLGTILGVWAHPDDEVFCSAGIMAIAAANGQEVACVTATKGEAGVQDESRWPADRLGVIREAELVDAYKIIGITNHHWLDYQDGKCHEIDYDVAVSQIKQFIDMYKPTTILTFGPDGMTGHADHSAVSAWATIAGKEAGVNVYHAVLTTEMYAAVEDADKRLNMFFNIDKPPIVKASDCAIICKLSKEQCQKKCDALKAMPSQTASLVDYYGEEKVCDMFSDEAFVQAR